MTGDPRRFTPQVKLAKLNRYSRKAPGLG